MRLDATRWQLPKGSRPRVEGFAVLAVVCWAQVVSAAGPLIRWSAPPECPSEATMRQRVSATLERPLESFDGATSFEASIALTQDTYRLVLTSQGSGEPGARVLVDNDCDALTGAAALAIALAVRASAEHASANGATPAASEPAGPATESDRRPALRRKPRLAAMPPRPPREASPTASPTWLGIEALGHADMGTLPSVGPGGAIGLVLGAEPWRFGLRAGILAPVRDTDDAGRGGIFWLGYGELGACARVLSGKRAAMAACALFEMGRLAGVGRGVADPVPGASWWLAPGARLSSAVRVTRSGTWAVAGVAGLVPLVRRRFVLNGVEQVHRPEDVVGRLELGVMQEGW